jgi:hypothetical protein
MLAKPKTKRTAKVGRRRLATARDPVLGGREARYILDITDLEDAMMTTLRRIKDRDGTKVFRESSLWLRGCLDAMIAT